ncbi:hypothetical protein ACFSKU_18020 [Pontibacter silvestris]|uniref:Lipoprotein n=1 Tax=Pontibacter silvestris TaxID=2305183 RepID=A0ABW4X1C5_9BACT|nr:hypothetical protein [Pontibacter silvestris]MCC9138311.1 hypothetical protein [Pontibacter silvestris]
MKKVKIQVRYPLFAGLCAGLMLLTSGCVSTYMPNVPNVPMFTEKKEISAGGHISLKGNISFTSAYAVSDHFAVMLNGSIVDKQGKKNSFQHNLLEAGGGYFTTFGPEDRRILEVYAGYGGGSSTRKKREQREDGTWFMTTRDAEFDKYFLQVNFTSKKKKSLRLLGREYPLNYGTALRASYVDMDKHLLNGSPEKLEDNIFLEPIFYTRMELSPAVQLQYTTGTTIGLKNRDALTAGYSVFSIGAIVNIRKNNRLD